MELICARLEGNNLKIIASRDRQFNIAKLLTSGKLSPKLRIVLDKLNKELKKKHKNQNEIFKLSMVHQHISSSMKGISMTTNKLYPYREDDEHNIKTTGTTAYHETDMIAHGDY